MHLRAMETTDLHVHLLPYDYYADRPDDSFGLSGIADLVDTARRESPNALLFDNGDFLQGTPIGDFIAYDRGLREGDVHPAIAAMNALGFDALTLGNHEFNYGLNFLMKAVQGAACPVVSANLTTVRPGADPRRDKTLVAPYALLDRQVVDTQGVVHPIRIGVIGFAPPQIVDWERQALAGKLFARDIVDAARAHVPAMREAGADVIIALAHSGIGPSQHVDGMENALVPLSRIEGIDAIMGGHAHLVFPGPAYEHTPEIDPDAGMINGKPCVMSGFWGSHLGVIDLLLQRDAGRWRVLNARSEVRAPDTEADRTRHKDGAEALWGLPAPKPAGRRLLVPPRAPAVRAAVSAIHRQTLDAIRRPVGHTRRTLHSFFAQLGVSTSTTIVAEAQRDYIMHHLADTPLQDLPVLSSVAPFKAGGRSGPGNYTNIEAGPLALRNLADLYVYPNMISALRLTGADLRNWLERAAAQFNTIAPGADRAVLLNPDMASYNFEILHGLTYAIDLTQPPRFSGDGHVIDAGAARITDLNHAGAPVDPDEEFIVCTNSFRANGGAGYSSAGPEKVVYQDSQITRDILCQYVIAHGEIDLPAAQVLRFAPVPGATVMFETGKEAAGHLGDIAGFNPEIIGECDTGFLQIALTL
ncbi:bifunctional 2',3'-cyclic-nucleotide 2'-phosphodiesterase/3'-nucleotidase [Roseicitreum antarcticum]|uniref:bifunctional 2',3'-cyclic-nucleotide 2'-phosphodiesterase/3'-nucleotidase n=1 Tax=Roseicitreum antarcticum TaxID=564137 RepID=UPI0015A473DF|nr:bifunctional 2',3'-cyclic-nucleotide 2'-phosphodiesterase/3'-nucleotidase [Roseicitreum antarcticum]